MRFIGPKPADNTEWAKQNATNLSEYLRDNERARVDAVREILQELRSLRRDVNVLMDRGGQRRRD